MRCKRSAVAAYCFFVAIVACACNLTQSAATVPDSNQTNQQAILVTTTPSLSSAAPGIIATEDATSTPKPSTGNQASASKPCTPQTTWIKYVVVAGDTLNSIAGRVGLSAQALATANCLANPNLLSVGQTLYVPITPNPQNNTTTGTQPLIGNLTIASLAVNNTDHKYHVNPKSSIVFHVDGIAALTKVEIDTSPNNGRSTAVIGTFSNPQAAIDLAYAVTERPGSDLLIMAIGFGKNGEVVQTIGIIMTVDGDPIGFQVGALTISPATMVTANPADVLVAPNATVTFKVAIHDASGVSFYIGTSPTDVTANGYSGKPIGYVNNTQDSASAEMQYQVPAAGTVFYVQAIGYSVFEGAITAFSPIVKVTVGGPAPSPVPTLTPTSVPGTTLSTYTNTKYGYTFQYPTERSFAGNSTADYVTLADQISVSVTPYDPQQAHGDGPVIESTEQIQVGSYPATRLKGYIGSIGGGTPQHYQSVVIPHNGNFYIFTVNELKNGVVLPVDRQLGPIPADALALFDQVISTFRFLS